MSQIKIAINNFIAGAGKDSVADYLVEKWDFHKYAFADKIYEIAWDIYGIQRGIKPPRKLLHHIGESLRGYDKTVWINETLRRVEADNFERVVITDTRKLIEHAFLYENGWNNVMVYCPPEVALERLKERDGAENVNEDLVLSSPLESQLRPLMDTMKVFNTDQPIEETQKEIDAFVRYLERKNK
jgi:hypothetical protein